MKTVTLLLFITIVLGVCVSSLHAQTSFTGKPQYNIEVKRADTLMGNIVVEMFPAIAPNHVRNWDSLVNIKFFDSTVFHRVIPGFMIQGGDPNSKSGPRDSWGYGGSETILDAEFSSVSHRRGILSAARTEDPNSASSQFFICVANYPSLDREYSIYGKVVSGMVVADSIVKAKRDSNNNPFVKISMFITKLGSNDSLTEVPKLVIPVNDSMIKNIKVSFRWNKVPGAMMYNFQLAYDSAFTEIIVDSAMRQIDTSVTINNLSQSQFYWRVMANNGGNASKYSPARMFFITGLSAKSDNNVTIEFDGIFPNPIKESATIGFRLSKPTNVTLTVLDMLGRNVVTLTHSKLLQGKNEIPFTRGALPAGVYIYRLEAGGMSITKRVIFE